MAKKKKEIKETKGNRKEELKEALLEHLSEIVPDKNSKFDIDKVLCPKGTKGSLRDYLEGDLKPADRYLIREILQELKNKELVHIGGKWWARI